MRTACILLALAMLGALAAWWLSREPEPTTAMPTGRAIPASSSQLRAKSSLRETAVGDLPMEPTRSASEPLVREVWPSDDALLARLSLAGVVLCAGDEQPIPGVAVQAIAHDDRMREPVLAGGVSTGEDGSFHFGDEVLKWRPHRLVLRWDDEWTVAERGADETGFDGIDLTRPVIAHEAVYELDLAEAGRPPDDLVVRLQPAWIARGRVIDAVGRPVARAFVVGRVRTLETDRDGRFRLAGASAAGPVDLIITQVADLADPPLIRGFMVELAAHCACDPRDSGPDIDLGILVLPELPDWWTR